MSRPVTLSLAPAGLARAASSRGAGVSRAAPPRPAPPAPRRGPSVLRALEEAAPSAPPAEAVGCIACPICRKPSSDLPDDCTTCRGYFAKAVGGAGAGDVIDLTPEAGGWKNGKSVGAFGLDGSPLRQELFRLPVVSFAYEKVLPPLWDAGLRDVGINNEYQEVVDFFGRRDIGTVCDISCGTGYMARRLAKSGFYPTVMALDFSEDMVKEVTTMRAKDGLPADAITVLRGDVQALPLGDGSLDAIYCGAAMHCWPDAEEGLNNLFKALKAGGKLYATTFLKPMPSVVFRFFAIRELQQMCLAAGFKLSGVSVEKRGVYAIIKCTKEA